MLDGSSGEHPVPPLPVACQSQQVAQGYVQLSLSISKGGDSTVSGQPAQCLITWTGKKRLLGLDGISCLTVCARCLLSCPGQRYKIRHLCSHCLWSHYLYTVIRSPLSLLFCRLDSPSSLSLSWHERWSNALISFKAPLLDSLQYVLLYRRAQHWT